jgi:hypothetical protein
LVLPHVREEAVLNPAVLETQFVADKVTGPRLRSEEVITVIEIHPFQVRPERQPNPLPKW